MSTPRRTRRPWLSGDRRTAGRTLTKPNLTAPEGRRRWWYAAGMPAIQARPLTNAERQRRYRGEGAPRRRGPPAPRLRRFNEARRESPGSRLHRRRRLVQRNHASMRPGANRRDHLTATPIWCGLSRSFNEARRESPGSRRPAEQREQLPVAASMRPGANRRDHTARRPS